MSSAPVAPAAFGGTDQQSDEKLMRTFQQGDKTGLDEICRRHWANVRGYIINNIDSLSRDSADDITQDVFAFLAKHASDIEAITDVKGLIYRKAFRLIRDYKRHVTRQRRDRCRTFPLYECSGADETTDRSNDGEKLVNATHRKAIALADLRGMEKEEAHREVEALLAQLSPLDAEAVRMKDIERYTAKAAAEKLGIPQSHFEWRYRKAHMRLEEIAAQGQ